MTHRSDPLPLPYPLEQIYQIALNGGPCTVSAKELAYYYKDQHERLAEQVDALIQGQSLVAGSTAIVASLGGVIPLALSLPAWSIGLLILQIRLVAAIAILCDYPPDTEEGKKWVIGCVLGQAILSPVRTAGEQLSQRVGKRLIQRVPAAGLRRLNQTLGIPLVTKYGKTGALRLIGVLPILGAMVNGALDGASTHAIGCLGRERIMRRMQQGDAPINPTWPDGTDGS